MDVIFDYLMNANAAVENTNRNQKAEEEFVMGLA